MSETTSTVPAEAMGMSDADMFADAMAPDAPETTEAPAEQQEQKAEPQGQSRDDRGRFAKAAETEEATEEGESAEETAETATTDPTNGLSRRLKEEADKRRAVEQEREFWKQQVLQMQGQRPQPQAQQQPAEAEDPFGQLMSDPDAFVRQRMETQSQQFSEMLFAQSMEMARQQHGDRLSEAYEAVKEACARGELNGSAVQAELRANPAAAPRMLMGWYDQKLDAQDPSRALARQLEAMPAEQRAAILQKYGMQPQTTPTQQRTAIVTPKSLTRATNVASDAAMENAMPDDAGLFQHAMGR